MVTPLLVPKSSGMDTVTVIEWKVAEGQRVEKGQALVTLETAKVTFDVPAPVSGVLLKVLAGPGSEVHVDKPLGYVGQQDEELPEYEYSMAGQT